MHKNQQNICITPRETSAKVLQNTNKNMIFGQISMRQCQENCFCKKFATNLQILCNHFSGDIARSVQLNCKIFANLNGFAKSMQRFCKNVATVSQGILQNICNQFAKYLQPIHNLLYFATNLRNNQHYSLKVCKILQRFFFCLQIFATSLQILCCRFPKDNAKILQPLCKTLQLLSINCKSLQTYQNQDNYTFALFCKISRIPFGKHIEDFARILHVLISMKILDQRKKNTLNRYTLRL